MPRRDAELDGAAARRRSSVEADEHLAALREHLLELAGAPAEDAATRRSLVETTFREMHTLKGAARSVGLRDVERVCASCEALLSALAPRAQTAVPGTAADRACSAEAVARGVDPRSSAGGDARDAPCRR